MPRISLSAIIIMASLLVFQGCAPIKVQRVYEDTQAEIVAVKEQNYLIGEKRSASIGESIVQRKQFKQRVQVGVLARPSTDLRLRVSPCMSMVGACESILPSDRDYEVLRRVQYQGNIFYVVSAARSRASRVDPTVYSMSDRLFLVSSDGVPLDRVFGTDPDSVFPNKLAVEPDDVKFVIKDRVVPIAEGYTDERLIFGGMSDGRISIRYTSKKIDDNGQSSERIEEYHIPKKEEIRFRKYRIKVISVVSDAIDYVVTSDGSEN